MNARVRVKYEQSGCNRVRMYAAPNRVVPQKLEEAFCPSKY